MDGRLESYSHLYHISTYYDNPYSLVAVTVVRLHDFVLISVFRLALGQFSRGFNQPLNLLKQFALRQLQFQSSVTDPQGYDLRLPNERDDTRPILFFNASLTAPKSPANILRIHVDCIHGYHVIEHRFLQHVVNVRKCTAASDMS